MDDEDLACGVEDHDVLVFFGTARAFVLVATAIVLERKVVRGCALFRGRGFYSGLSGGCG